MEQQRARDWNPADSDAGRQVAQLATVAALVDQIAGVAPSEPDAALDRAARIGSAYEAALPIVQKRFDLLAAETAGWAAAAAKTLLGSNPPRAAAACLGAELAKTQRELERILGL